MRRQQDRGAAALELGDQLEEFDRRLRIEAGGRLVEDRDLGALDDDLGQPQPLPHAAREGRDALVRDFREAHARQRVRDALGPFPQRQAHQLRGVGEILHRGEIVVEADGVGQIADTPLDLQRRARRIVAEHADMAGRNFGQAQHHQDRGGLAGAVGPEQAEHLAALDGEADGIDRIRAAVALGEIPSPDDDVMGRDIFVPDIAHRRPNLATAPSINSSATPITPAPAMPHTVEVATVMRNWLEALSPRELALTETM